MQQVGLLLLVACLITLARGHSWAQCADYSEENGQYWDQTKCRAYPRDYATKFGAGAFGADVGFNYQPTDAQPCQTTLSTASYTTTYPAATYGPGQRVCLAWPPKNHVAAKCLNANIPDSGTRIYRSGLNPTADPTLTQFEQNLVFDFGANTQAGAGVGFQNCPDFCANADKALCTGCFNIPTDLAQGKYTFLWEWDFNSPTDRYTTCWDVTIAATTTNTVTSLAHIGPDAFAAAKAASLTVAAATAGTAGSASSGTGSGTGGSGTPDYGPCPTGSIRCNCTLKGSCDSGLVCTSGVCVSLADVKAVAPSKSYAGNIAAAVILTFLCVAAIAVGVVFVARKYPSSRVGVFMHGMMDASASVYSPNREPLLDNPYLPNNS